jgi:hypothetical protein
MKSIISGALIATAVVACLSLNVQASPIKPVHAVALSDTGKMSKMKMDKMKMSKMAKDSMKMSKKMDKMKMSKKKMSKDSTGKM